MVLILAMYVGSSLLNRNLDGAEQDEQSRTSRAGRAEVHFKKASRVMMSWVEELEIQATRESN